MKKTLAILLALAVVGVFAFAADAAAPTVVSSFSAYLDGGVKYTSADNTGADSLVFYGNETPIVGGRMNFNYSFAYGDFGAKIRFRANPYVKDASGSYDNIFVRRAWAYYNFFDGMVQLNAGIFGIGDFSTPYEGAVAYDNPNTGLLLEVKPVKGLNIGYLLPAGTATETTTDAINNSIVAASYSMDKVFSFTGWVYKINNNPEYVAAVTFDAVENLTATAEMYYATGTDYNLATNDDSLFALENFAYTIGAVTPEVYVTELFPNDGSAASYTVNPCVAYDLNATNHVGADFTYRTADSTMSFDGWYKLDCGKNYLKLIPAYDTQTEQVTVTLAAVASF